MQNNKFPVFLLISLALTAFLGGYILIGQEIKTNTKHNTGTLLDRFEGDEVSILPLNVVAKSESSTTTLETRSLKNLTTLNSGVNSFALSPDGSQIAYFVPPKKGGGEGKVFVSDSDDSNLKIIFKTRVINLMLNWIDETQLSIEVNPLKEPIILKVVND